MIGPSRWMGLRTFCCRQPELVDVGAVTLDVQCCGAIVFIDPATHEQVDPELVHSVGQWLEAVAE